MKKLFFLFLILFSATHTYARDISVTLNAAPVNFDQPPIISNGRTLVPMRAIFEELGCSIEWNNATKAITATTNNTTIILTVNDTVAHINETQHILDVPPMIVNNRTLVPIRFISEALNCNVVWNNETSTVEITNKSVTTTLRKNLYSPTQNTDGKYMSPKGTVADNEVYFYSSPINVSGIENVYFSFNRRPYNIRFVTAFDDNMNVLPDAGGENISELNTTDVNYIIITATQSASQRLVISDNNNADIILPGEICVASGKELNIFNRNIISLNADDYLFTWNCDIGESNKDGYYIDTTDVTPGIYALNLVVKYLDGRIIFSGKTDIKIVKNTLEKVNILPIGDSLTNNKPWLSSVVSLSGNNVTFIGTRGKAPLNHEGRSGFSSGSYLKATEYSFENEGIHPFWDGTKFNWNYYLEQNNLNPDAVQIFLGTNGLSIDPVKNAENIRTIADEISHSNPQLPIFIINTMHRGTVYNENGEIDSVTMAEQHVSILNLTEYLNNLLANYENVHIVPVYAIHDNIHHYSEKDSVHPTNDGYSSISDIIYSTYCAYLD